ncbi:simple sugar transport system permease protein [Kineosphaera limosa]|uniref:Xylose transport system permease protein XylH n=1 Tax=Kineosphaera limosa NBRC 100340 TaxID=1184609 RepID=K6WYS0_9MICO|nr:ABC transporter permease [Kineosphaera limosa]NYE01083.1 simple sugar transport system permease protein [Kineosphaera limosa]GAB97242.1 putative ABC transporter permease protein [Kineosphaera limosa NBRC 100340]
MSTTNTAPPEAPATPPAGDDRVGNRSAFALFFSMPAVGAFVAAIVLAGLFFVTAEPFRNVANVGTILYAAATVGIMAIFVALLMIGGEFDLSTGVAVTFSGLAAAHMAWYFGLNVWVGIFLALVMSLAVGAFNGFLLIKTGLPSFLVTLSTYFILWGVNLAVTRIVTGGVSSNNISDMDGWNSAKAVFASSIQIGPINFNIVVLYWLLLTAVLSYVLLRTKIGNWILAAGGDAKAARAVGVPVTATKIGLFMGTGFAAWVVGMHTLFQYNNVQSGQGIGQEFVYIIAAVIGGCLLTGGYGSIVGGAVGALIYGMAVLGISYAGWDVDWLRTFLGVMLLGAVLVNMYVKKKAESL